MAAIQGYRRAGSKLNHHPLYDPPEAKEAVWQQYQRKLLKKIIKAHDKHKTGKLDRNQVVNLLTDLDSSTPPGTPPSQDQLDFLLKSSAPSREEGPMICGV